MYFVFFFFQAEDGIRDIGVTGVQTCALPISACCIDKYHFLSRLVRQNAGNAACRERLSFVGHGARYQYGFRWPKSEERRVGKECRSRWWAYDLNKRNTNR